MIYQRYELDSLKGSFLLECYVPQVMEELQPALRPAVVICPGGGYWHVSPREGEPIALALNAQGINAYVVTYHVAHEATWPNPLMDLAVAMGFVRSHAQQHHTHPDKIAVMGFSAGGHLAASLGLSWQDANRWLPLHLTPADVKPNAMVLGYPVITAGEYAHRGSFRQITGSDDLNAHAPHSLEYHVTPDAPPTFLWHTWDDQTVPVENSLLLSCALRRAGVSCEMHIYEHGSHGLSLCNEITAGCLPNMIAPEDAGWMNLAIQFLRRMGTSSTL